MSTPYVRAPHKEGSERGSTHPAPNAALLIDFDNVTMGMRSDLSEELKTLLNSDIIKGKVAVQRAYADWRRYPQYIVPLSEASIDLIFAPAYGSNKKNATDIRMAIDALELIFIRPEIGTFILLTGDSDFSSLVLKLKEYGKYVIGVGIQESSSDILVQNCDEYYSYTSLAGLRKTTEAETEPVDPWLLVERALERMERRNDVMRSDRLKQVMIEIDAGFDEGEYGFSKFSRFLTEASSKGLVELKKMDNGQYEVRAPKGGGDGGPPSGGGGGGRTRGRASRTRSRSSGTRRSEPAKQPAAKSEATVEDGYRLLEEALEALARERDEPAVRDSDVKRKMLDLDRSFDEAELGFSKFSRFLQQADRDGIVEHRKRDSGNYEVSLPGAGAPMPEKIGKKQQKEKKEEAAPEPEGRAAPAAEPEEKKPAGAGAATKPGRRGLGPRGGERTGSRTRGGGGQDGPPILEGQVVGGKKDRPSGDGGGAGGPDRGGEHAGARAAAGDVIDPDTLGLPTDRTSIVRYLANSYKGVGEKTAESLVDELGTDLFEVLQSRPERVRDAVPSNRADQFLEAWQDDFSRRKSRVEEAADAPTGAEAAAGRESGGGEGRDAPEERPAAGASQAGPSEEPSEDEDEEEEEPQPTRLGRRRTRRTRR